MGDPDPPSSAGLGSMTVGFGFLPFFFLIVVAIFTPILAIWTPCAFYSFYENSKKLLRVLGVFVTIFVVFLHVED